MKALLLKAYKDMLHPEEIQKPVPGKNEVLVQIHASGVNPLDIKIKNGIAAHAQTILPAILGIDMAGVVEAVGSGVSKFKKGNEVYGMIGGVGGIQGSLAEYTAVDADLLAIKPCNITMRQAAALPLAFITAWEGLADRANVCERDTVLIQGGAGGVGHIAVQLAKQMGAEVFATASQNDHDIIRSYGATPIDYLNESLQEYLATYTGNEGFDVVYDTIGGIGLDASFELAKRYTGHVVSILGWGMHNLSPLSFRGATYSGVFTLYPLLSGTGRARHSAIMEEATRLIEEGKLMPRVDERKFTFETIADAYTIVEQGAADGKIVVDII